MPRIAEKLPVDKKRDDPKLRLDQINEILNLPIGEGYLIETYNFPSWKTYFYAEKRENCPDRDFTFKSETIKKDSKIFSQYKVWRIK